MSRQVLAGYSCGDPAPPSILRAPEAQGGSSKLVLAWKAERGGCSGEAEPLGCCRNLAGLCPPRGSPMDAGAQLLGSAALS